MNDRFLQLARRTSAVVGSPAAFTLAIAAVVLWALTGPIFSYSATWQLVINTATTIVTFLMVFLIQSTQNRDSQAIHLKLDELLRGSDQARTGLVQLEDLSEVEVRRLREEFAELHDEHPPSEAGRELVEDLDDELVERAGSGDNGSGPRHP